MFYCVHLFYGLLLIWVATIILSKLKMRQILLEIHDSPKFVGQTQQITEQFYYSNLELEMKLLQNKKCIGNRNQ